MSKVWLFLDGPEKRYKIITIMLKAKRKSPIDQIELIAYALSTIAKTVVIWLPVSQVNVTYNISY